MFDKLKGAFETYSQSTANHPDQTLRTFDVKMGPGMLAEKVIDVLKELKYKKIQYNDIYNEIYTEKAGYEVTIHLIQAGSGTTISVSVYAPDHRGKTRKALRFLMHTFKERFNPYLAYE